MWHSYSPLFTLGLLGEHSPTGSSRSPNSCPVEESPSTTTSPQNVSNDDYASAIYFTLQTRKRDTVELRSFLYLDLADRKQHAPSHRRKFSTLTKSTSWTCTADVKSFYDFARTEKPMIMPSPAAPVVPARRRTSRESLRNIPSPKPAPSTTLPDLPISSDSRSPPSSVPSSSSKQRSASTAVSPLLSPTPRVRRPASLRSESISSHDRRKSRMDALACLEGRAPNHVPSSSLRNNFMSFSDDEDEKSTTRKSSAPSAVTTPVTQIEDLSAFADVEDEADVIIPTVTRKREAAHQEKPIRRSKPGRKRRSTLESWFPLKSFIDLKDDDLSSWNWRSFIEIGGVS